MDKNIFAVGDSAPAFTLSGMAGSEQKKYSLSDWKGKWVVLYFYPKDDTPGCTQEACDFRDMLPTFANRNAVIVGVSRDPLASHEKFTQKYGLPFVLLSDPNEEACTVYGVLKEKTLYGKKYLGIDRSTFLINPQGIIAEMWRNVKVPNHIPEVLSSIQK